MIQRIQTIYLLISAGISAGLTFVFHLWTTLKDALFFAKDDMVYLSLFLGSAALSLLSIFMFKNRKSQFKTLFY